MISGTKIGCVEMFRSGRSRCNVFTVLAAANFAMEGHPDVLIVNFVESVLTA
jgi:hypothetical protein